MKARIRHIGIGLLLAVVAALPIGCTQDTDTDTTLPDGKYPMTFTATQTEAVASPQTRVSDSEENETHKSQWTTGDRIKVAVSEGGNAMETTCTLNESGGITNYNPPLYWKTNQSSKINAWYSNITGGDATTSSTVSLSNQTSGLAYVLKADEVADANYQSAAISLNFKHQLAKVRVKVVKGTYTGTLDVTAVSVKGFTSCNVDKGTITTTSSSTSGDISLKKSTYGSNTYWEANLVPGIGAMSKEITINADNKTTTCTLDADASLTAGNVYTYIVTVNMKPIDLSTSTGNIEISEGDYIITSNGSEVNRPIVVSGNANITLTDVNIKSSSDKTPAITVKPGVHLKLNVRGTNNTLSSTDFGGIVMDNNASIEIKGEGLDNSSLTVTAGNNGWDGASCVGIGATQNATCGDISISNITLNVTGSTAYGVGGAAIGTSSGSSACGNITICNSNVDATGGNAAAAIGIGGTGWSGTTNTVGDIRISGSTIKTTIAPYRSNIKEYGAGIGMCALLLSSFKCGKIILDCESEEQLTTFTTDWSITESEVQTGYKIGKGYYESTLVPTVEFGGVYLKGRDTGKPDYEDGWGSW